MIQSSIPSLSDLSEIAKHAMIERDLYAEFPPSVRQEAEQAEAIPLQEDSIKDMRDALWFSIDNDDSKDLDQLTLAKQLENGSFKIYIAIADVDMLVRKGTQTDRHAAHNTTSVYTPTKVFPMLPEKFSTDLTSLNENEDRYAIVVEIDVDAEGGVGGFNIYRAYVHNHAKLAYNGISAWLNQAGIAPARIQSSSELADHLKLQDRIAFLLKENRKKQGTLTLDTIESQAIIKDNQVVDLKVTNKNRARDLIEEFMIAANISTACYLKHKQAPSLRRVVRVPKRWDRIVEIAAEYDVELPEEPDSKALDAFLIERRFKDPLRFPDLCLTIVKLLGSGEYVVEYPNQQPIGHFGLALKDYTHATAPNRRFPDLVIQRILKASFASEKSPYTSQELESIARQCTKKEDDAAKVERQMKKSAAAMLLSKHLNEEFEALVTGASPKGTWVRLLKYPIEGKLVQGQEGVDVGQKIKVRLISVDIAKGFIDFERLSAPKPLAEGPPLLEAASSV